MTVMALGSTNDLSGFRRPEICRVHGAAYGDRARVALIPVNVTEIRLHPQ